MTKRGRPRHPELLTPREQEVLALLREGLTNPQIAERLGIGLEGVKYHVSEILSKLHVSTREEAASWREERHWWLGAIAFWRPPLRAASIAAAGAVVVSAVAGLAFYAKA
jgi:DNA-binding CsgD family transcriptional regulator